jgi:ligand-binding sensor domain-containing protein
LNAIALRLSLLASIAAAWCGCCVGQPLNRPIKSLYHTVWKVRDGVPNDIVAIQQTRDGYLWLGTGDGLFRFDGVRFERYEPNRGDALFSGRISALLATEVASTAQSFGQEDDISVITVTRIPVLEPALA